VEITSWPSSAARRPQSGADRRSVPHFSDQDDVRVLPERGAQTGVEGRRVHTDLTLAYRTRVVRMQVLDRILERDDVLLVSLVQPLDHGRLRGALPRTHRSGDQHEPVVRLRDVAEHRRQKQLLERRHGQGDDPHDDHDGPALP
jgi:hypothetical protein